MYGQIFGRFLEEKSVQFVQSNMAVLLVEKTWLSVAF